MANTGTPTPAPEAADKVSVIDPVEASDNAADGQTRAAQYLRFSVAEQGNAVVIEVCDAQEGTLLRRIPYDAGVESSAGDLFSLRA